MQRNPYIEVSDATGAKSENKCRRKKIRKAFDLSKQY